MTSGFTVKKNIFKPVIFQCSLKHLTGKMDRLSVSLRSKSLQYSYFLPNALATVQCKQEHLHCLLLVSYPRVIGPAQIWVYE